MTWTVKQELDIHDSNGIIQATAATPEAAQRVVAMANALNRLALTAEAIERGKSDSYRARNGRMVSIQMDDGERADIVHSDLTFDLAAAATDARTALAAIGAEAAP